jgi:hypothetical protein
MEQALLYDTPEVKEAYKLKLLPKKLRSGKCQVKFYATALTRRALYGYILVDAKATLKEVVEVIKSKIEKIGEPKDFYHHHLYAIGRKDGGEMNFMVFESNNC